MADEMELKVVLVPDTSKMKGALGGLGGRAGGAGGGVGIGGALAAGAAGGLAAGVGLKIVDLLKEASPALQGTFKMMSTALKVFFLPFGNFLSTLLRPMAVLMIRFSIGFLKFMQDLGAFLKGEITGEELLTGLGEQLGVGKGAEKPGFFGDMERAFQGFLGGLQAWRDSFIAGPGGGIDPNLLPPPGPPRIKFEDPQKTVDDIQVFLDRLGPAFDLGTALMVKDLEKIWTDLGTALADAQILEKAGAFWTDLTKEVDEMKASTDDWLDPLVEQINSFGVSAGEWIDQNLIQPIANFFTPILDAVKNFVNGLIEAFNGLIRGINSLLQDLANVVLEAPFGLGSFRPFGFLEGFQLGEIPLLQRGGTIEKTGMAVVHKGETVIPAGRGAGDIHITINEPRLALDADVTEVARRVSEEIMLELSRTVRV